MIRCFYAIERHILQKITDLKFFFVSFQGNIFYIYTFCEYTMNRNKLLEYVTIGKKNNILFFFKIYSINVFEFSFENLNRLVK